jgi:hypothetical protein
MIISDHLDVGTADEVSRHLYKITDRDMDLTHCEILMAHMLNIGITVWSVECPDCRQLAVQFVEQILPDLIRNALEDAQKRPPAETFVNLWRFIPQVHDHPLCLRHRGAENA